MLVAAGGLAWLSFLGPSASVMRLIANLLVVGAGQATFQPPNNSALMGAAPRNRQGVAAGVLAMGRVVGQSLSVALAGALFGAFGGGDAARVLRHGRGDLRQVEGAFLQGMHAAFVGCACVALASSAIALVRGRDARARG
jgi:hypothetical protein